MTERSFFAARGRVVAALVGAGLLLSACQGGGPTPGNSPTASSSSASPSASPTPTPSAKYIPASAKGKAQNVPVPVKPALADQNSKAGLEAFTTYWFALLNYGYETGDLKTWKSITSPQCLFCSNLESGIDADYSTGGWQVGGLIQTPKVEVTTPSADALQKVTVQVVQTAATSYKAGGTRGTSNPPGNDAVVVLAAFKNGVWAVSDMHPLG